MNSTSAFPSWDVLFASNIPQIWMVFVEMKNNIFLAGCISQISDSECFKNKNYKEVIFMILLTLYFA